MTRLTEAAEARLAAAASAARLDEEAHGHNNERAALNEHVAYDYFPETLEFQPQLCSIVHDVAQPLIDIGVPQFFPARNPLNPDEQGTLNYLGALHTAVITAFAMGLAAGQALADEVNVSDEDVARFMDGL